MKYIECPKVYNGNEKSLFLAGGITSCPDWQKEMKHLLKNTNLVLLNPRRINFVSNKDATKEQITWEFNHLRKASAVSFWFPKETLCPIALYELGKQSMTGNPIFIGVHPDYKRKEDVEIQIGLIRPEVQISYSLKELAKQIIAWEKIYKSSGK